MLELILLSFFSIHSNYEYYQGFNSLTALFYLLFKPNLLDVFKYLHLLVEIKFKDFLSIPNSKFNFLGSAFPDIIQKYFKMIEAILEQECKVISPEMRMAVACKLN